MCYLLSCWEGVGIICFLVGRGWVVKLEMEEIITLVIEGGRRRGV